MPILVNTSPELYCYRAGPKPTHSAEGCFQYKQHSHSSLKPQPRIDSEKQRIQVLLSLGLCHSCPLEDWEFSLHLFLCILMILQELISTFGGSGRHQSIVCGWAKSFVTGVCLEQLLVPSVRQVARIKLSPLRSYNEKMGNPPHHFGIQSYGLLGRIFTLFPFYLYCPKLKYPKNFQYIQPDLKFQ